MTGCSGIKITPGEAINSGNVASCQPQFDTGGPDLSCLVTGFQQVAPNDNFPSGFWVFKLCGIVATGLSGIAVKFAQNNQGCNNTVGGVVAGGGDNCVQVYGPAGSSTNTQTPFPTTETKLIPYTIAQGSNPNKDCPFDPRSSFVVVLYGLNSPTASNTGTLSYPDLGNPGTGCRWVFIDVTPNINNIGLQICFSLQSPPAGCGQ